MARAKKRTKTRMARPKRRIARTSAASAGRAKLLKAKMVRKPEPARVPPIDLVNPAVQQQLKQYEDALRLFQQQRFLKAKEILERILAGPSRELADRAGVHIRVCDQRISRELSAPKSPEDYYQHGVAMMNLGRWDDARQHLERARKLAPKADHVHYAMAALDCLTGEAEAAMTNLKLAIDLRPENRYHARNDEDFAFLQEDPRFTELLYPERDNVG